MSWATSRIDSPLLEPFGGGPRPHDLADPVRGQAGGARDMALDGSLRGRRLLAPQGRHHQRVIAQQFEPFEVRHEVVGGLVGGHRPVEPGEQERLVGGHRQRLGRVDHGGRGHVGQERAAVEADPDVAVAGAVGDRRDLRGRPAEEDPVPVHAPDEDHVPAGVRGGEVRAVARVVGPPDDVHEARRRRLLFVFEGHRGTA